MHINLTFSVEETLKATKLALDDNTFVFGDTYWLQKTKVAIEIP